MLCVSRFLHILISYISYEHTYRPHCHENPQKHCKSSGNAWLSLKLISIMNLTIIINMGFHLTMSLSFRSGVVFIREGPTFVNKLLNFRISHIISLTDKTPISRSILTRSDNTFKYCNLRRLFMLKYIKGTYLVILYWEISRYIGGNFNFVLWISVHSYVYSKSPLCKNKVNIYTALCGWAIF